MNPRFVGTIAFVALCNPALAAPPSHYEKVPEKANSLTRVSGSISVPPPQTGNLTGFGCGNIVVTGQSNQGTAAGPLWRTSVTAVGDFSSGACRYYMLVSGNSPFYVLITGKGTFANCPILDVALNANNGNDYVGPYVVHPGVNSTQNLALGTIYCHQVPCVTAIHALPGNRAN